jgi:hypothetical protein
VNKRRRRIARKRRKERKRPWITGFFFVTLPTVFILSESSHAKLFPDATLPLPPP